MAVRRTGNRPAPRRGAVNPSQQQVQEVKGELPTPEPTMEEAFLPVEETAPQEPYTADQSDEEGEQASQDQDGDSVAVESFLGPDQDAPYEVVPPDGRILEPGDPLVFDGVVGVNDMIMPTEDVYRKVYPRRCQRPTFVQVVFKGTPVPVSTTRRVRSLSEL